VLSHTSVLPSEGLGDPLRGPHNVRRCSASRCQTSLVPFNSLMVHECRDLRSLHSFSEGSF
uniref:Uncharacterized protein n=1 Tax=Lupinus albus TaxID=3870 RepID=Q34864_LUPAL|nr:hypothetical protein [Lupinus albus]